MTAVEKTKVKKKIGKDSCRKDKGEEEDWKIPVEKTKVKEENGRYLQKRQR